jgi:hypothetical protein
MENNDTLVLAILAVTLALAIIHARRIDRMQQEIDLLADGDLVTLKLKRKLDGYAARSNDDA